MDQAEQSRRLDQLRAQLRDRELAVFLVPRVDENQCEYVAPCFERLAFVSGFTGSAGLAMVGRERAAIFVDGRYTIQVAEQVDAEFWERRHSTREPASAWLGSVLKPGDRVGFDARLFTRQSLEGIAADAFELELPGLHP